MIGLLGGSFDPVHHGHLIVAQVAVEALGLDSLRFVPVREQPFKRGRHRSSPEHRAAMLSLAIAGSPEFELERSELERPGPSYSVETLEDLGVLSHAHRETGPEYHRRAESRHVHLTCSRCGADDDGTAQHLRRL